MGKREFYETLALIPMGVMVLCIIFGVVRYVRLGKAQKLIIYLVTLAFCSEIISIVLTKSNIRTYPVFHIYAVLEYSLLALIFFVSSNKSAFRKGLLISILGIWLFGLINGIYWQPLNEPNTNITTLSSLILVGLSIGFFLKVLNETKYPRIERSSLFWILIGVLVYFSSSFLLFTYANWLKPLPPEESINVWLLNVFFNVIHYLCFTVALWMKPE